MNHVYIPQHSTDERQKVGSEDRKAPAYKCTYVHANANYKGSFR